MQHWWMAGLVMAVGAALLLGPRGIREGSQQLWAAARQAPLSLLAAAGVIPVLLLAARRYANVVDYAVTVAAGTILFVVLVLLCFRSGDRSERAVSAILRLSPAWLALILGVVGALIGHFVLGDMPHVSDEVAYQFQARTIATGAVTLPAPPVPEAFNFIHLMISDGKWYSIMNPGWPVLLAIGEMIRLPWIINPVLGGLGILTFAGFFREIGLEDRERRLDLLLLACCPPLVFMAGTYMAHPANLVVFGVFCWAWARMLKRESLPAAMVAGLALAFNLLIRPVDTAAVTLPFIVQILWHIRRRPRLLAHAALVGIVGSSGIGATLAYNRALTGDPMLMPMTQYFDQRNPQEKFGIGFGPDMGTKLHGDEWPGFTPVAAVKVTAYRLVEFLKDMYGLPFVVGAVLLIALRSNFRPWGEWRLVLIASGVSLVGTYFLHFYHGIAYGSRHYYLAVPAVTLILGRVGASWLQSTSPERRRLAAASVLALLGTTLLYAVPPLLGEYEAGYRGVSPGLERAIRRAQIGRAIVFVDSRSWAWKAAFPLNRVPLNESELILAKDLGARNGEVITAFPGREVYYLAIDHEGEVRLRLAEPPPEVR